MQREGEQIYKNKRDGNCVVFLVSMNVSSEEEMLKIIDVNTRKGRVVGWGRGVTTKDKRKRQLFHPEKTFSSF